MTFVLRHKAVSFLVIAALVVGAFALGARAYTENLSSCDSLGPIETVTVNQDHPSSEVSRWCRDSFGFPVQEKLSGDIAVETPAPGETIESP